MYAQRDTVSGISQLLGVAELESAAGINNPCYVADKGSCLVIATVYVMAVMAVC